MSGSRKKVVVRLLNGEVHWGYLPATELFVKGEAELLLPDGRAQSVATDAIKYIAFVKDFNLGDAKEPEQLGARSFSAKPRGEGIWIRVQFLDDERLEGLVPGGLHLLDALLLERGIFLEPPDRRGNIQRLFIPRSAMISFEVLGVAGISPAARRGKVPQPSTQGGLFDNPDQH